MENYLSKDKVFLLQRYYYFLDKEAQTGLLIMDETDEAEDRKFIRQMDKYFSRTDTGQLRSKWIVPLPFFVSSAIASPIQAADICIYCVNWVWRLEGMDRPTRDDLEEFRPRIRRLQWSGQIDENGAKHMKLRNCPRTRPVFRQTIKRRQSPQSQSPDPSAEPPLIL